MLFKNILNNTENMKKETRYLINNFKYLFYILIIFVKVCSLVIFRQRTSRFKFLKVNLSINQRIYLTFF